MNEFPSWGLYPKAQEQVFKNISSRFSKLPTSGLACLPRGLGRSYGDSCLNDHGLLIGTSYLNHFIDFDQNTGKIICESGVSFDEILKVVLPTGWFLPVTPGTKYVTVGGAIANDVHGKNHHRAGNFGHHVLKFELLKSSGERLICSRESNSDLFFATIGGLGLTGFITWAEFKLTKIQSSWIHQQQIQFNSLADFFSLSQESERDFEFTVSWVDCVNSKDIRGIFIRGNFGEIEKDRYRLHKEPGMKRVPFFLPKITLNSLSVRAFNELYYRKNLSSNKKNSIHYDPFFYPLDSIHHWNKIYGRRGFLQYQFVIPYKDDQGAALYEIFDILKKSQMGSFLAVLKTFGSIPSEGMLSFPKEGVTLALDFPNHGEKLLKVLSKCDEIVKSVQGAVYPAKDARMSKESFAAFYPRLSEFEKHIDPKFSSSFWRRVR
ncbi:FAD-binding oxidoreductase [Bdellovibrio sp. 22V]|uniref:FAD-binding oxidoreductase n=1 Tax=Bdellovibrio sp. 22V TaxID=3044166 RepID=UPI002542866F|nr:FAD-binding oxidoreductase [Bdellovibrio sp. 22V]WII71836.1 FAD-binding oxidoreductase [Bdellovibrio sp. 22V]